MILKHTFLGLFLTFSFYLPSSQAAIITQNVEYKDGKTVLEGFLAYDDAIQGKRPGVIVVHEWKGLNNYARRRAQQLAEMGYVAFAADMYGKGMVAKDHAEAAKLSGVYRENRKLTRKRAEAAYKVLAKNPHVNSSKIAAIGYCFGGMTVLEMARAGMDLKGVSSFHGSLPAPIPAEKGKIKAKVVVFHGSDDTFAGASDVPDFETEMKNAEADWTLVILGGAAHSFTVPEAGSNKSSGMAYDEKADKRSWEMLAQFLKEWFS